MRTPVDRESVRSAGDNWDMQLVSEWGGSLWDWMLTPGGRGQNSSNCRMPSSFGIKPTHLVTAAAAKSLQSCPTLCDPTDGSPQGSPVPGILQARTLEWVAISFSNTGKWQVKVKSLSLVRLLAIPWTEAHQAPPSLGFSRQECWSGVPWKQVFFNSF